MSGVKLSAVLLPSPTGTVFDLLMKLQLVKSSPLPPPLYLSTALNNDHYSHRKALHVDFSLILLHYLSLQPRPVSFLSFLSLSISSVRLVFSSEFVISCCFDLHFSPILHCTLCTKWASLLSFGVHPLVSPSTFISFPLPRRLCQLPSLPLSNFSVPTFIRLSGSSVSVGASECALWITRRATSPLFPVLRCTLFISLIFMRERMRRPKTDWLQRV